MSVGLKISRRFLSPVVQQLSSSRSAIVFERQYDVGLARTDGPDKRRLRERHSVYRMIDNEQQHPLRDIKCVLTRHVDGVGVEGEVVTVKRARFWNELGPSGSAVYATQENIDYYSAQAMSSIKRTPHALQTYRLLCGMNVRIRMNPRVDWTLTKSHVQVAFRRVGIYIENQDSIVLPEEPITNETSEQTPFTVIIKINGLDEARVNCYICPWSTDPATKSELCSPPDVPLFRNRAEVEQELLDQGLYYGTAGENKNDSTDSPNS